MRPNSKATGKSAQSIVSRLVRQYRQKYPMTIMQALEVNGQRHG